MRGETEGCVWVGNLVNYLRLKMQASERTWAPGINVSVLPEFLFHRPRRRLLDSVLRSLSRFPARAAPMARTGFKGTSSPVPAIPRGTVTH